ncbi:UNVERIFIED_CONTAM: hypothetical protein Q9R71_11440 [Actinomycetes bacterium ARC8]|nr:hypothetical protein [Actinomycetes bacterium ARC8]
MKPGRNPEALDSVTIRTDGSVTETVTNPDGTLTVTGTGHIGLIMFPTDEPAGPTTTHFILESTSGQAIDICAGLAD